VCYVHIKIVPFLAPSGEQKTKPTQHSVTELRSRGIQPDVIVCRSDKDISEALKRKISLLCDVPIEAVVSAIDAPSIYDIPLVLHEEGLDDVVCRTLGIDAAAHPIDVADWEALVHRVDTAARPVRIGIVGKYVNLPDAYLSVVEALRHAGFFHGARMELDWIDAEMVPDLLPGEHLRGLDGMVIPGGFGERGIEGMIAAARYAREHAVPCLGLCLGLQVMVIDAARHLAGLADANSGEFDSHSPHKVIDLMPDQQDVVDKGGTMRLGSYPAMLAAGSQVSATYGAEAVTERHRHRYEVNARYRGRLEEAGLRCSGVSPDGRLVEFVELPGHPFWVGTQAHPEFKSRPDRPHPLFRALVGAARERADGREPRLIELSNLDAVR
ncbi:MAG: CTP synthase, partial [Acidimicrobiales bacterium]